MMQFGRLEWLWLTLYVEHWRVSMITQFCRYLRVILAGISETLKKVSVLTTFDQSRLVSVSSTTNFHCLKKSWSRQFWNLKSRTNFPGIVLYSLDNFHLGLGLSLKIYSLSLGLDIETGIEKVSVSVSTLRPGFPKSQSRKFYPWTLHFINEGSKLMRR